MVPLLLAGATLLGGALQGRSTERAARTQANAEIEAAKLAAEEARFRPVGTTTRFGSSQFQYDPSGRVSGASYNVSPELQAYQNRFRGLASGALTQAEQAQQQYQPLSDAATGLFGMGQQYLTQGQDQQLLNIARQQFEPSAGAQALTSLGQQYVGESPKEVAARYMQQQQDLLAPSRERQMAQLQNQLFQQGRSGLSVGSTGARPSGAAGLGATTPEMEAYYNALAQQDLGLASQAQQAGQQQAAFGANLLNQGQSLGQGQIGFGADLLARQQAMEQGRTAFGAGLFGTGANLLGQYQAGQVGALTPFEAYFGQEKAIEGVGQQPLDIGINIGAKGMSPTAANALLAGGMSAAQLRGQANAYNPFAQALMSGAQNPQLQNAFGNLFSGGTPSGAAGYNISPSAYEGYYNQPTAFYP